jgi:signal transduction histidine kinase
MKNIHVDFEILFDSLPGLYLLLSPEFKIIRANKAYADATQINNNEVVGRGIFEVFPDNPDDNNADGVSNLRKSLELTLSYKKPHTMAIQRYDVQKPDGSFEEKYWSPMNMPIINPVDSSIAYIVHRAVDVTESVLLKNKAIVFNNKTIDLERKVHELETEILNRSKEIKLINQELEHRIEERTNELRKSERILQKQNALLISQNKELEQYTYITSHDLQEPLRTLISFSDLLKNRYSNVLDEKGLKYIDFISDASGRMRELVKVLMEYSLIGKKRQLMQINTADLLGNVLADMSLLIAETKAEITCSNLPVLTGFPIELRQLFQNLISNAIKYSKKDLTPIIHISAEEKEGEWEFTVSDNGIGIDMNCANNLFQVFKRLHNRGEYEGTGIGLAISKKIVELHGGNIWVESLVNEGSAFKFILKKFLADDHEEIE